MTTSIITIILSIIILTITIFIIIIFIISTFNELLLLRLVMSALKAIVKFNFNRYILNQL